MGKFVKSHKTHLGVPTEGVEGDCVRMERKVYKSAVETTKPQKEDNLLEESSLSVITLRT